MDQQILPQEQWRDIPGFEGIYQVSDHGRVKSLARQDAAGQSRKGAIRSLEMTRSGHARVRLCKRGKYTRLSVHRLVLEVFVGPCPEGMECCHNDGSPPNNHVSNLRWDTRKANTADRARHGNQICGEDHPWSKLTEPQVLAIRRSKQTYREIGSRFGITEKMVGLIKRREAWAHI